MDTKKQTRSRRAPQQPVQHDVAQNVAAIAAAGGHETSTPATDAATGVETYNQNAPLSAAALVAKCIYCGVSLAEHYKGVEFVGCDTAKVGHVTPPDGYFVPPIAPVVQAEPLSTSRKPRIARGKTLPDVSRTMRRSTSARTKRVAARRGRIAGLYVATKKSTKDLPSGACESIHVLLRNRKRGLGAKDVIKRTQLTPGTAGWALGKLIRLGYAQHVSQASA